MQNLRDSIRQARGLRLDARCEIGLTGPPAGAAIFISVRGSRRMERSVTLPVCREQPGSPHGGAVARPGHCG